MLCGAPKPTYAKKELKSSPDQLRTGKDAIDIEARKQKYAKNSMSHVKATAFFKVTVETTALGITVVVVVAAAALGNLRLSP